MYIIEQAKKHPCMTPQDAVKMAFQGAFGAEHLLADKEKAWMYFIGEWNSTEAEPGPLTEAVSDKYTRGNIAAFKAEEINPQALFNMFFATASAAADKDEAMKTLNSSLKEIEKLAEEKRLPFTSAEFKEYLASYNFTAVHHSDVYRNSEKPAYRLIDRSFECCLPYLKDIFSIKKDGPVVIAIDGRAASGKTTLASGLETALAASVIHMDDFFLPKELRTAQRLEEPGGNVHYERFISEVIPQLNKESGISYTPFNCSFMGYDSPVTLRDSKYIIVEGSYSHHPKYGPYMDMRIFTSISPEEQMERIIRRNGEKMAQVFKTRWIPMEEKYFQSFNISALPSFPQK